MFPHQPPSSPSPLSLNVQYWNPIFQTTEKTSSGPACHFTRTFLDVVKTIFKIRLSYIRNKELSKLIYNAHQNNKNEKALSHYVHTYI